MLWYLEIALINAVMVVPLALLAEVSGRVFRRPALTHVLWVLILVKLVTPPVWQIPLLDHDLLKSVGRQLVPAVVLDAARFEMTPRLPHVGDEVVGVPPKSKIRPRTLAAREQRRVVGQVSTLATVVKWIRSENFRQLLLTGALFVWSLGALAWFVVQGSRCLRFRRSLQRGYAAGADLQRFSDRLARRLGLSYSPTVWLMPGVMSPMLWGSGQSLLLIFPEEMLDRLDEEMTATLLTHELAHYRRRDHLVRVIALLATGFFWWHPVVWWARREIEATEEECCDALVVSARAAPPKRYAEAILEVVDFLAEHQLRMPALATGLGQVPFLRQRLTWIMRGPRRQDFGYFGRILCLIIACLLPLQPSWLAARTTKIVVPSRSPIHKRTDAVPTPISPPNPVTEIETVSLPLEESVFDSQGASETRFPRRGLVVRSHSFDGRFVVLGNKSIQCLLDFETGQEFDLNDFMIQAMAFASSSHEFVTIGGDGFLRLWDAETCEVICAWSIPGGAAKTVDMSSDGEWIATGGRDGIVRIWNRFSQRPVRELARELAPVNCVRFSPDRDLLAVATGDWMTPQTGRIALFKGGTWTEQISMNWNAPAAAVAFPVNGDSLISGDWQGRVARWNLFSGELLGLSEGHKDLMAAAEFSANGSPLAVIDVPDLPVDATWSDVEAVDSARWFFNAWSLKRPTSPMMPPNPRRP